MEPARPVDPVHRGIGEAARLREARAPSGNRQNPAAVRDEPVALHLRPRVEDRDARVVERRQADRLAAPDRAGVALGRDHHGQRVVVGEGDARLGEPPGGRRMHGVEQLRPEPHGEDLRLGIAEADVVLDEARRAVLDHQPDIEHALERGPPPDHLGERRADDTGDRCLGHLRGHHRRRRVGAHAAGVRPAIAVEGALVVLRGAEKEQVLPVGENEEARLLAGHEFLDDDARPRSLGEDRVQRRLRLYDRLRDGHALAGGEAVGLDDDRRALAAT